MSLIGLGQDYKGAATAGFRDLAELERGRKMQNEANMSGYELAKHQQKMARRSQQGSMTVMGAGMGASAGAKMGSVGGPWGAVIGAAAGFIFGSLF